MNSDPTLTVAIPTYNRASSLEKVLLTLIEEKNVNFNILVSDNNSTDNTKSVVEKLQLLTTRLSYSKNDTNIGYSANVRKLYEMATTDYVWFLCDDDTVMPGAVKKIVNAIDKYHPSVALFNCTWINQFGIKSLAGVEKDIVHSKFTELGFYDLLSRTTYLSYIVVDKSTSIQVFNQTDYTDNVYFQTSLVLYLLSNRFKLCEIALTVVHRNVGYKYGEFFKFSVIDFLKAIYIIRLNFNLKKVKIMSVKFLFTTLQLYLSQKIGLFKFEGQPSKRTWEIIFRYCGNLYGIAFFAFPIINFIVPTFTLRLIYRAILIYIHGWNKGNIIYSANVDRAYKDDRITGFVGFP